MRGILKRSFHCAPRASKLLVQQRFIHPGKSVSTFIKSEFNSLDTFFQFRTMDSGLSEC